MLYIKLGDYLRNCVCKTDKNYFLRIDEIALKTVIPELVLKLRNKVLYF